MIFRSILYLNGFVLYNIYKFNIHVDIAIHVHVDIQYHDISRAIVYRGIHVRSNT